MDFESCPACDAGCFRTWCTSSWCTSSSSSSSSSARSLFHCPLSPPPSLLSRPYVSNSLLSVCVSRCLPLSSPPFPRRERSKCESTGTINSPLTCSWQSSRKNSISEEMLPKTVRLNKRCKGNGEDIARSCCSLKLCLCLHFGLSSISHFDLFSNLRTHTQTNKEDEVIYWATPWTPRYREQIPIKLSLSQLSLSLSLSLSV